MVEGSRVTELGGIGKVSSPLCPWGPLVTPRGRGMSVVKWGQGETRQSWKETPKDGSLRSSGLIPGFPVDFMRYKTLNGVRKAGVGEGSERSGQRSRDGMIMTLGRVYVFPAIPRRLERGV